jgi:hypothetical protein
VINPLYDVGDIIYLRESAALGILEAMRIGGVHRTAGGWVYSITTGQGPISGGLDHRSKVGTQILYYSENEFLNHCDALLLVEANTKAAYLRAKAQRQIYCPDNPTSDE